jgi:hypothetical protein
MKGHMDRRGGPEFFLGLFWGQVKKGKLARKILLNCWDGLSQRELVFLR